MNKLVIQDDEGKTTVVPLIRDEITIGRKEGNTIRLTERNVSRKHARILRNNGAIAIEDLNSYNGVRVNGTRISGRCQLNVSDRVQIGDYLIELKTEDAASAGDGEQRTQPIERVDPMGATPTPVAAAVGPQPGPTAIVDTNRIQGQAQPASFGQAAAEPKPAPEATGPGRMVILSTNFAGQEHVLTKPAMIIGRTEDNDIVVNHRSISRHHAKIVRENGRYAICDLQSSNGVRVNGEEYGKVELRRGDVVDLGHVRLRFVEPGEDFLFGRDAHAVDIATGGGKGMIFALLALLLVGGGVGIFALTGGGGEGDKADVAAGAAGDGDVSPAPAAATSGDGDTAPAPTADDPASQAIAEARKAITAERWKEAKASAEKALAADSDNPDAQKLLEQAEREMKNQGVYDQFKKAVTQKKYGTVADLFNKLDPTSVYKDQARDDHDRMRDEYTAEKSAQAETFSKAGKCSKIAELNKTAQKLWAETGDALDRIEAECRDRAVAASPPKTPRQSDRTSRPKKPTKTVKPPKTTTTSSSSASSTSGKSAAQLTTEARAAAKTGHWGKALRLCEAALSKKRGDQEAAMVCALAACNIKSSSKAKRYMKSLRSPSRKGMARQICLKNGVDIPIN